jgi:DNA-binding NtrC family response regulator
MNKVDKILYIDSDIDIFNTLRHLFKKYCHDNLFIKDINNILDLIDKHHTAIIIIDISLFNIDDLRVLEQLKQQARKTEIIFIIDLYDINDLQKAFDLEVKASLIKPINIKILKSNLEILINNINK